MDYSTQANHHNIPTTNKCTSNSICNNIQISILYADIGQECKHAMCKFFLDEGAAINAFKLMWNCPDKFSSVFTHLGDFHFIKEIFNVLGTLIYGSGFSDILFQANLCTSESLGSVIKGLPYNRCWHIYEPFDEALESP